MQILVAQMDFSVGDFEGNLNQMLKCLRSSTADLVVFPECSICGYPAQDLLDYPDFTTKSEEFSGRLIELAGRKSFIFGGVERNIGLGRPVRNAAYFVENGSLKQKYFKRLLPTYDVFDEDRFFEAGREPCLIPFMGELISLTICEDIWGEAVGTKLHNRYNQAPLEDSRSASLFINISASPFEAKKVHSKREMLRNIALKYQKPFIYANGVGANDSLIFDGRSYFWSPTGELLESAKAFEEDLLTINTKSSGNKNIRLLDDEVENIYEALVLGIKDYARKTGFKKAVIGLSGGIDSAVVTCLAADALGAENLNVLLMPSRYSSKESLEDAFEQTKLMKIESHLLSIEGIYEASLVTLKNCFQSSAHDLTEENIQSRIRGLLLMAYSNKLGHLVLTTGNKSELATGYCTLYGDMNGGLAPLSDVYKMQVYELGREANKRRNRIPERVFQKPPSAELRENQTDQDFLPEYEKLDPILYSIIEEFKTGSDLLAEGHQLADVELVLSLFSKNEYKRFQMPLGLKVSSKAFGVGRRHPLVQKFL